MGRPFRATKEYGTIAKWTIVTYSYCTLAGYGGLEDGQILSLFHGVAEVAGAP